MYHTRMLTVNRREFNTLSIRSGVFKKVSYKPKLLLRFIVSGFTVNYNIRFIISLEMLSFGKPFSNYLNGSTEMLRPLLY